MKDSLWYLDGAERKERRKELKLRKRWKSEHKVQVLRKISTWKRRQQCFVPPSVFKVNGMMTGDKDQWNEGLRCFMQERYHDDSADEQAIKDWVEMIMEKTRSRKIDGLNVEGIGFGDVVGARAAITQGTAGGKDGLVGEIWKKMPFAMIIVIWFYFRLRAEYGIGAVSDAWRTWCLFGLPKIRNPMDFGQFRYICKSPVLQKWYLRSVTEVIWRTRLPSRVNTYGFRRGRGPMLITELLRRILFIGHEWGPHLAIGSFDIRTAFDSMDHSIVFKALVGRGVPEHLAAAFIRELIDIRIEVEIPGLAEAEGVEANTGGRQGGTDTTVLWNYLMEYLLDDLVRSWGVAGVGFKFESGPLVNHLIWAADDATK